MSILDGRGSRRGGALTIEVARTGKSSGSSIRIRGLALAFGSSWIACLRVLHMTLNFLELESVLAFWSRERTERRYLSS